MNYKSRNSRVVVNVNSSTSNEPASWLERNPILVGIITSLVTSIITIIGFGLTWHQIQLSENHRVDDLKDQKTKDLQQDIRILKQAKRDSERYQTQIDYNKQQLTAIKKQAEVAEKQLYSQKYSYDLQYETDRPIFRFTDLGIDSTKYPTSIFCEIHPTIKNSGKRKADIGDITYAIWNPYHDYYFKGIFQANVELASDNYLFVDATTPKNVALDSRTCYYFKVVYRDNLTPKQNIRYIHYFKTIGNSTYATNRIYGKELEGFKKAIEKNIIKTWVVVNK